MEQTTTTRGPRSFAALFAHVLSGLSPEQIAAGGPLLAIELLVGIARAVAALRAVVAASPLPFDGGAADTLGAIGDRCRSAIVTLAAAERGGVPIPAVLDGPAARDALLAFVSLSRAAELQDDPTAPPGSESLAGIRMFALDCADLLAITAADRAEMERTARMDLFGELPPACSAARSLLLDLAYTARESGDLRADDHLTAAAADGAHLRALTDALPGAVLAARRAERLDGLDIGEAYRRAMSGLPEAPPAPVAPFHPGDLDDLDDLAMLGEAPPAPAPIAPAPSYPDPLAKIPALPGHASPAAVLSTLQPITATDPEQRGAELGNVVAILINLCGLSEAAAHFVLFDDSNAWTRLGFTEKDRTGAGAAGYARRMAAFYARRSEESSAANAMRRFAAHRAESSAGASEEREKLWPRPEPRSGAKGRKASATRKKGAR